MLNIASQAESNHAQRKPDCAQPTPTQTQRTLRLVTLVASALLAACSAPQTSPAPPYDVPTATAVAPAPAQPPASLAPTPASCADKSCLAFPDDASALRALLLERKPRAIGFGEAHTPAGFAGRTTVRRFTDDLLPVLAPRTSALLVELLAPASGCETAKQAVGKEAAAVTTGQAQSNQGDYLRLGQRARELGVVPDVLRASCDDLQAIAAAGELGVVTMMETIARLTARAVEERSGNLAAGRPLVLAYGGALHNDVAPRPGRETWSYGPGLQQFTKDGYVEIDLVLPALVTDSPSWQSFGWYAAQQSVKDRPEQAWLIQNGPSSYALVLAAEPIPPSSESVPTRSGAPSK